MPIRIILGLLLGSLALSCPAGPLTITLRPVAESISRYAPPLGIPLDTTQHPELKPGSGQLAICPASGTPVPAQFLPDKPASTQGTLWWLGSSAIHGQCTLVTTKPAPPERMQALRDPASGRWNLTETGALVLAYNYQTNFPGERLASIHPDNLKYAQPRGDYIHPLMGLDGESLTLDWPVDHPHHRGIYWAWPEVECTEGRGDLHALQRVFARPTGQCAGQNGPLFAQVSAENLWLWEDRKPLVRELACVRVWRTQETGRWVDLEFQFLALEEGVTVARRETKLYGGLNIRLAAVQGQQILTHTDPPDTNPRTAWADLAGVFAGGRRVTGLAIFQFPSNPNYPGEWVQYEALNWLQPTFPAPETRYPLKKSQPLVLKYRLWIHAGSVDATTLSQLWPVAINPISNPLK